ncbi:hypothetical protein ACQUW5_02985 [Legionella sp. CNM-1927-20]|uniref:hypothetical protein n=1 Tax=Legionella sp. CNM-1927-20 TaxID=3422221 RepID=UPI00403ABA0F
MDDNKKRISIFFPFRAFHNQDFNFKVLIFLFLPLLFNGITLYLLPYITAFWGIVFDFFLNELGFANSVLYTKYTLFNFDFILPSITLSAGSPSAILWFFTLVLILVLFLLSFLISEPFTPLKYLFRAFLFVLATSLLYFYISPAYFPYDIEIYTRVGMMQILSLLFFIPWIFALTYYLFGYKFIRKIVMTAIVLIYFIIFGPFQNLLSAYIIHKFSLLYMSVLYIFFGLLIDIFILIAFYGFALSIEPRLLKYMKD